MPLFKNILVIHIPKTGGSSLEKYLSKKFDIDLDSDPEKYLYMSQYNNHTLQHSTYEEIEEILIIE